jgi:acetoin utilization deacetylase AcuC-like enzyme
VTENLSVCTFFVPFNRFDDGTADDEFLRHCSSYPQLIETQKPDFIFYLAGVDILASDKLGKLGCIVAVKKEMNWF